MRVAARATRRFQDRARAESAMARCASRLNHALQKLVGEPKKALEKQREGQKRDTNQEMLACAFAARVPSIVGF
jgi:hypothetical protein